MNRIYRLVFNPALGQLQVAAEFARAPHRPARALSRAGLALAPLAGALLLAIVLPAQAQSLPQNGQIIAGSASINSSGNQLNVNQSTQSALIQWQNFNIGAGNRVNFNLPSSQAVSINQVTGGTASIIAGQMVSNGQVFLLNPSGIAFTSGASVNVGGLLATTLNVGTPSLPVDGGPLPPMFQLTGGGTGAMISNSNATLLATDGGISLVGGAVSNNGVISAPNGSIDLVAAGGVLVTPEASSTGYLRLSFATTAASTAAAIGVNDTGTLTARTIGMNAMVGPGLASHGINTSGTITANAIDAGDGVLTIRSNAPVLSSATITAATADIAGSSIDIAGGSISANGARLTANTGNVNVSGTVDADMIELTAGTVSQGSSGALQGAVKLDVQGTAGLGGVDNRIGAIAGTVGGDLTLVTRSALSNNGALQVAGSTTLTASDGATRKDITLGNTGNSFGGPLFATGNDIVLDTSGALTLGGIDGRSLDANGASIRLAGTLLTTGGQLYRAPLTLIGNSSVTAANGYFAGSIDGAYQLSVTTSQATTFAGAVGSVTPLQALSVAAGGGTLLAGNVRTANDIVFSGPLRLDADIGVTSTNGKVSINGAVDSNGISRALTLSAFTGIALGGPLGATAALKSLQATAGVIELGNNITSTGNIVLNGSVYLTGNARLHSSGGAISSGAITSGVSASQPEGYDLGLKAQSTLQLNGSIAARDVDIDALLFNGFGITSKGALRINSALPLIQGGVYLVTGTATFGSIGDIQLINPGNRFGGVVSLDGVNARVNAQDLQLGNVRLGGALRLELGGSLIQAANTTLDVEGTTTLIAGDAITLNGNNNHFGSSVSVSGNQVQIRANDLLAFSGITAASLQATAPRLHLPAAVNTLGLQRYDGAVTLLGDTRLSSDLGQIYFNGSIDGAHALTIERALEVVFNSTLGGSTALGSLDTSGVSTTRLGGDISSSGTIALGGLSLWSTRGYSIASSGGDVRIGGAINGTADGQSSLSLRAAGALDLQGNAGTSNGARLNDLTLRGASIAARALQTGGKLDIGSGAGFAQGGTLTVGGDAVFSAGNGGNLVLDDAANSFGGKVALQGNQAILRAQSSLALDSVNLNQLTAYGNGPLSLANATVLGNVSLDADALLFSNASITGVLNATARTGSISQGSGTLAFGANSILNAGNDIVLGTSGNAFGSGLRASGRDVTLTSTGALDLAQLQARDAILAGNGVHLDGATLGGDLTVDSSGTITQGGVLDVAGNSRLIANGDITLDGSGNRFGGNIVADGNDIVLASADRLQLAGVRARGSLAARAGAGGIQQSGAVQVDGRSDFDTSGDVALNRADNRFGAAVGLQGRAIDLRGSGDLQVDRLASAAGADVRLHAGSSLDLPATAIDTGNGNLTLIADAGQLRSRALLAGHDVTLSGRDGVYLGAGLRSSGALTLASSNADIVQEVTPSGAGAGVLATGPVQVTAGSGRIALGNAGNQFGGALNLDGGDISVVANSLTLGTVTARGDLSLASGGDIGQQGVLQVGGNANLQAAGNIDLQAGGNRFGGAVAVRGGQVALASDGALQLQGVNAAQLTARSGGLLSIAAADIAGNAGLQGQQLQFGDSRIGGDLQADGRNGIGQVGTLRVAGSSLLNSTGAIALGNRSNDLRGTVSASAVGIDLASAGDLRMAAVDSHGGALRLQAGAALVLPANVIDTGASDLQLLAGGALQIQAGLRGNTITLGSGQDLQLRHDVLAGGVLQLDSGGAITQSGGILAAQRVQGSALGKVDLQGDNRIAGLGDFRSDGLTLVTTQALQVGGNVQAGESALLDVRGGDLQIDGQLQARQLRLQSAGAIRAGSGGRIVADTLSGRAAGATSLGDASLFLANAIGTLGDFQSAGGFSLTNAGTLTLASLNGSAFSVDAANNAFHLKVQGGDILQQGTTPVLAGPSRWWSSGGIGTQPLPIYLTSSAAGHVIDFIGRPPAYFYAIGADGLPLTVGGALNVPSAILGARAQGGVLPRVAYVDMSALSAQYRAFGIVQPGIRLPADQTVACDSGDPDAECAQ